MSDFIAKRDELQEKSKQLYEITEAAGPDRDMDAVIKAGLVPGAKTTKDVVEEIQRRSTELTELEKELQPLQAVEAAAEQAERFKAMFGTVAPSAPPAPIAPNGQPKSIGRLFVESRAYKERGMGLSVGPVSRIDADVKTLFETGAGWAPESTRTGIVTLFPTRPIAVVDTIPQAPTRQDTIKYMEETTYTTTNVVEKAEGAAFGEPTLALTERSQAVEKLPVVLGVTDEQLEDEDAAEAYVNQRLKFMLQQRLDLQVLAGTGVTPLLLGTESVTGIQSQAKGTDTTEEAVYKAMRQVRDDGFAEPSLVYIRAAKWEEVRLRKTADGIYLYGPPSASGAETLWGKPVLQTNATTSTKAITGDYPTHATLWIRRGFDVQVGYTGDQFKEGKKSIRMDIRLAMVHYRPKAFAEVTGL